MDVLHEFQRLLRVLGSRLRYGTLSRAPLRLVRLAFEEETVRCDWLLRPPDVLDHGLNPEWRDRRVAIEALHDALTMRELVFTTLPQARFGQLRAFSESSGAARTLMIAGSVSREAEPVHRSPSMAMRALSCGFRFRLTNGFLEPLE
jgi:hypothetical protein